MEQVKQKLMHDSKEQLRKEKEYMIKLKQREQELVRKQQER